MRPVAKRLAAVLVSAALLLAASLIPIATAAAAAKSDATPKLSAAASKTLKTAQDALEAKDYPAALTALKATQDLPNKSEYDEFTMNQMYLFYYSRTNDMADAEKVLEALVASRYLEKADLQARLRMLAQLNYQAKDYDKAIQYAERDTKEGDTNDDVYTIVDQSYYLKDDYAPGLRCQERASAGREPAEA